MMSTTTTRKDIETFLASPSMAVVGVARDPKEFGYRLFNDLKKWGYKAVPVNPHAAAIADAPAFATVQAIGHGVEAALLLTAPSLNEQIVHDCAEAGVKRVWFYGVGDRSSENAAAIAYCQEKGIAVIPGFCPYMFLPESPFFHKLHGFFARLMGGYPH